MGKITIGGKRIFSDEIDLFENLCAEVGRMLFEEFFSGGQILNLVGLAHTGRWYFSVICLEVKPLAFLKEPSFLASQRLSRES